MKNKFQTGDQILNLRDMLNDAAKPLWIDEDTIMSTHPCRLGKEDKSVYSAYDAAMCLVSERHGKFDLVNLVGHLLYVISSYENGFAK